MGRILVVDAENGFLELVRRVLAGRHDVEVTREYQSAAGRLAADALYDAVICGVGEVGRTIEIFEKALASSSETRLIPAAGSEAELRSFSEQWNSSAGHTDGHSKIGSVWLRRPCTTGDILALFPATGEDPNRSGAAKPDRR